MKGYNGYDVNKVLRKANTELANKLKREAEAARKPKKETKQ